MRMVANLALLALLIFCCLVMGAAIDHEIGATRFYCSIHGYH